MEQQHQRKQQPDRTLRKPLSTAGPSAFTPPPLDDEFSERVGNPDRGCTSSDDRSAFQQTRLERIKHAGRTGNRTEFVQWGIYHQDREFAREAGDPCLAVVSAPGKDEAEKEATLKGICGPTGLWAHPLPAAEEPG